MNEQIDAVLEEIGLTTQRFDAAMAQLSRQRKRYSRLWAYYANPMRDVGAVTDNSEKPYRHAQEWGMPARITGYWPGSDPNADGTIAPQERKEVVVENDIAWRIDTMIDYLFGELPQIRSIAPAASDERRADIQALIGAIIAHNGGVALLQQMALMGAVYGFVDVAVTLDVAALEEHLKRASGSAVLADTGNTQPDGNPLQQRAEGGAAGDWSVMEMARLVSLQIVEPARTLVLSDSDDAQRILGYAQVYPVPAKEPAGTLRRIIGAISPGRRAQVVELWTDRKWWRWRDDVLAASGGNSLGRIPVVHIQNAALPFSYGGASDVEALIPLQDELNTRLSDRAHRVAVESFRMYLGKNVDLLAEPPGPGRAWHVADPSADVKELGGASNTPSEDSHIAEVREALDKTSGVPPVAAGAIRNRIGNLTSAAALRITLMSLLARTRRKQALYGAGIRQMCEIALQWLDTAGVLHTTPAERAVEITWPNPLPENNAERLAEAKIKLEMGLGKEVVLRELGY